MRLLTTCSPFYVCVYGFLHAGYGKLAEDMGLLKLGGSDFHGKDNAKEVELGACALSPVAIRSFLNALSRIEE